MGCGGSKQQPQRVDRERKDPNQTPNGKNTQSTSVSQPTPSSNKKIVIDDRPKESFTDFKLKEKEMLDSIVNRTALNFIDISQSPMMDQLNMHMMKSQDNAELSVFENEINNMDLFSVPACASSNATNLDKIILDESTSIHSEDIQMLNKFSMQITNEIYNIKVHDDGMDSLIVTL